MWRCADLQWGDEFCGCGEWGSPLPPLHNIIKATGENWMVTFGENDTTNFIGIEIETDPETGDSRVFVYPYWIFADERYVRDWVSVWEDIFVTMDREGVATVIYNYSKRPSKIFEALNEVYKNPTDENIQAAQDVIWGRIPLYELHNTIEATSENSADTLNYDGDVIEYAIEADAESWEFRVVISPQGIFNSELFEIDGENIWNSVFTDETWPNMKYRLNETSEFPSDVFNTINAVFQDPTAENIQAANNAIVWWRPTIINKALGTPDDETYMFVGPDLFAGNSYIDIYLETDPETWDTHPVVFWDWIFDPEWVYWESASLVVWAFEVMDIEWIHQFVGSLARLTGEFSDLGTINSNCMSLVQAIYNNPTEENQQALIDFLHDRALNPEGNSLIVDDAQSERIREGLGIPDAEIIKEVIERSDEEGQSWEPLVVEDYYTYYLQATSENSADVKVYVWDYAYLTNVAIEMDGETWLRRVVVGECQPYPSSELNE